MLLDNFLHIVTYVPSSLLCYYFIARMLRIAHPWRLMLGMTGLHVLAQTLYAWGLVRGVSYIDQFKLLAQTGIYLLGCLAFSRESLALRLAAFADAYLCTLGGEVGAVIAFSLLGGRVREHGIAYAMENLGFYFFMQAVNFAVLAALLVITYQIWERVVRKSHARVLRYFALFPVSQVLIISIAAYYATQDHFQTERYLVLAGGILFCMAADLFLFRALQMFSRRAVAEERAVWYETLLDQQQRYYAHMLADLDDAARMRHDYRNQLQTVYALLQTGEHDAARAQLDEMTAALEGGAHFCANRVVNALLAVKAGQFQEAGVTLQCRCDVPEYLTLPGVELCSLFSNLLDNALSASCLSAQTNPTVTIASAVEGSMLTVRCRNPYSADAEKQKAPRAGHGLGLEILRDLADRHSGEVKIDQTDDTFTVTVWLQLPE